MTFTVTAQELFLLLLGIFVFALGCYLFIVLKNVNRLILGLNQTVAENQEKIGKLLSHLEEVTGTTASVSNELKKQFEDNKVIVRSIIQTGADSMFLVNDATSRIRTIVANFNEVVRLVSKMVKKMK